MNRQSSLWIRSAALLLVATIAAYAPATRAGLPEANCGKDSGSFESHPRTWNVAEDFSITCNPNGQWSYGSTVTLGGDFTVFTVTSTITFQVRNGAVAEWNGTYLQGDELFPIIAKYYGDPGTAVTVFSGTKEDSGVNLIRRRANGIVMHPTLPGLGYGVIRWTAPKSRTYVIKVSFFSADINVGATTDVHVQRNHVSLFDGDVNGVGSVQNYSTGHRGIGLNKGDVIDLVIGPNGDLTADSTGVDMVIEELHARDRD